MTPFIREYRFTIYMFSSVHFSHSVMSDSLQPHGLQHARPPCPSPTPSLPKLLSIESVMPIESSHPLSSPSPPAFNLSQHQGLFKWVSYLHQVPKVLEFHTNYNCHKVVRSLLAYKKKLFGWWDIWAYLCLFGLDFPANSCFNLRAIFPFHLT